MGLQQANRHISCLSFLFRLSSFLRFNTSIFHSLTLSAQPSIYQLIFRFRGEEIEAVTLVVEPVVIGGCATLCNPDGISGSDVEDDFGKQTVVTREDGHADYLIFLNPAIGDEALHGFAEDGIRNGFKCKGLNLIRPKRAKNGWVGSCVRCGGRKRNGGRGELCGDGRLCCRYRFDIRWNGLFATTGQKEYQKPYIVSYIFHVAVGWIPFMLSTNSITPALVQALNLRATHSLPGVSLPN
jgi:hypothetical protein